MERRVPLAIFLCFLTVLGWAWFNPPQPADPDLVDADPAAAGELQPGLAQAGESVQGLTREPGEVVPAEPLEGSLMATEQLDFLLEFGRPGEIGSYQALFDNQGGRLLELRTGVYFESVELTEEERTDPENWVVLLDSLPLPGGTVSGSLGLGPATANQVLPAGAFDTALWQAEVLTDEDGGDAGIRFTYGPGNGLLFEKTILAVPGSNELSIQLAITNTTDAAIDQRAPNFRLRAAGAIGIEYADRFYPQPTAIAVGTKPNGDFKTDKEKRRSKWRDAYGSLSAPAPIVAVGAHSKYFAVLLRPADEASSRTILSAGYQHSGSLRPVPIEQAEEPDPELTRDDTTLFADAVVELVMPPAGERAEWNYRLYAGPKDHAEFLEVAPGHAAVMDSDLSFFSGIGKFLAKVLVFLHGIVGNWGFSIILLTVLIRAVLFPINRRSQTAMARYQVKMKRVQPKLEAIKKKHENEPQALRQAQAKVMQEEGVFPPLGGCLPIFLQLPIFFGLFAALRTSFELRQAPFIGYITDLSRPDRFLYLGESMPLDSLQWLNILPILMVVLWIWQQRTMPKPSDDQAAQVQKIMMFMPLVMGVFLYNYASGLSLYMITQSGLGIFEQKVIKKVWPVDETEPDKPAKGCGCAPMAKRMQGMAEKQAEAQKRLAAANAQTSKNSKNSKNKGKRR